MEPHPISLKVPPMSAAEYADLRGDIAKNGLLDAITLYEGKILDGRHRNQACHDVGVPIVYETYDGDDPLGFVLSKNLHRRSLSAKQRRELAKEYIQRHVEQSDRALARETKVHHETVASIREEIAEESRDVEPNGGAPHYDGAADEPAFDADTAPATHPQRVEQGLKNDGTPRKARGRKPGSKAGGRKPRSVAGGVPTPAASEALKRIPPPQPGDDPEQNQWVARANQYFIDDVDTTLHAFVAIIGYHAEQIQAKINEQKRRFLVGQFAESLGLKLADT